MYRYHHNAFSRSTGKADKITHTKGVAHLLSPRESRGTGNQGMALCWASTWRKFQKFLSKCAKRFLCSCALLQNPAQPIGAINVRVWQSIVVIEMDKVVYLSMLLFISVVGLTEFVFQTTSTSCTTL